MKRRVLISAALMAVSLGVSAQKVMKAPAGGKAISDELIGIFFEDISSSADGGLYAELVQNGSFEYSPAERDGWGAGTAWKQVRPGHSLGTLEVRKCKGIHKNNPTYMRLHTERVKEYYDYKGWKGFGIQNDGFEGISVKAGEKYNLSLFMRNVSGEGKSVRVALVEPQGWGKDPKLLSDTYIKVESNEWKKYEAVLSPDTTCHKAALQILVLDLGDLDVDMVSLMPQDTYKGHGLRKDLAQALADLNPKFMRFPGGCVVHGGGDGFWNTYRWKTTIGPKEQRKSLKNTWGYHQSMGLGYFEYFQFCEDLGMEPVPILPAGVSCQGTNGGWGMWPTQAQDVVPMSEMDEWVAEAIDLIDWANGDPATNKWAKMRADAGHPKPFNLKYLGVGNEDLISDVFAERFTFLNRGIKAKYPDIQVVGTVGPFFEGSDYEFGWKLARQENVDIVDEHYYVDPGWYIHNQNFYDRYDRNGTKVYLGEWASRNNKWENALVEALHLTNLERNADVVVMSSYAPLFCKDGHSNWNPDLIYFNNTGARPTPGYYVQKAFGVNNGVEYIPSDLSLRGNQDVRLRINASIVKADNGDLIVKLVNLLPASVSIRADLGNLAGYDTQNAQWSTMTGNPGDGAVTPAESTKSVESQMTITLDKYSFTVIRIKKI